jgi:hypothetical protein
MSQVELSPPAYLTAAMAEAAVEAVVEAVLNPPVGSKLAAASNYLRMWWSSCPEPPGRSSLTLAQNGWNSAG